MCRPATHSTAADRENESRTADPSSADIVASAEAASPIDGAIIPSTTALNTQLTTIKNTRERCTYQDNTTMQNNP